MDSETERETKQRRRVKRRVDTIVVLLEIARGEMTKVKRGSETVIEKYRTIFVTNQVIPGEI